MQVVRIWILSIRFERSSILRVVSCNQTTCIFRSETANCTGEAKHRVWLHETMQRAMIDYYALILARIERIPIAQFLGTVLMNKIQRNRSRRFIVFRKCTKTKYKPITYDECWHSGRKIGLGAPQIVFPTPVHFSLKPGLHRRYGSKRVGNGEENNDSKKLLCQNQLGYLSWTAIHTRPKR